jgi:hypothetical protein
VSCLVITGMHRSGTSLVASLMQAGGVDIGERLVGPAEGNPRGYFEDADFYEFHERALQDRGLDILVAAPVAFEPTAAEREAASALVARRAGKRLWGWKDPRTTLFLDFWLGLVPDAHFLFVYRHPIDVLASLVRRREFRGFGLLEAIDAWRVYNDAILAFVERHPTRTVLCNTYAALERIEDWRAVLRRKTGVDVSLTAAVRDAAYHPAELRRVARGAEVDETLGGLRPDVVATFRRLEAVADLSGDADAPRGGALAALAGLAPAMSEEGGTAGKRAVLHALLAYLAPEPTEEFFVALGEYLGALERSKRWLDEQCQLWRRTAEEREQAIEGLRAWIEKLEGVAGELRSYAGDLERGKSWLEQQWHNYEDLAAQAESQVKELQQYAGTLERYADTLASRRVFRFLVRTGVLPARSGGDGR